MAGTLSNQAINKELSDAIDDIDVEKTKELLEKGANPNEALGYLLRMEGSHRHVYLPILTLGTKKETPKLYDILELLIDFGASLQRHRFNDPRQPSLAQYVINKKNINLLDFLYTKNPELFEHAKGHQYEFTEPGLTYIYTKNLVFFLYGLANDLVSQDYEWIAPYYIDEISAMRESISEALPILANYIDFRKEKGKQKIIYNYILIFFTKEEIAKIFEDVYLAYPSFNRRSSLLAHRERYIEYGNNNASLNTSNNSAKTGGRRKKRRSIKTLRCRSTKTRRRHK
jgi:hypothetical protein